MTVRRALALTVVLGVPALVGFTGPALASGPLPDPAPQQPVSPWRPDPAPGAKTTPARSAGSTVSARTVESSGSGVVAHTTQPLSTSSRLQPNAVRPATRVTTPKPRKPATTAHKRPPATTEKRFVRWPGLILGPTSLRTLGTKGVIASTSRGSGLLLAAGLALALLAVGETTFLALVGERLGFRLRQRPWRAARRQQARI